MIKLDAKAAADRIRPDFAGLPALPPEAHHQHAFAKEVCGHLGIEADAVNVSHVLKLLHDKDVGPHVVESYPKMATRSATEQDVTEGRARFIGEVLPMLDKAGNPVIHESADAEKEHPTSAAG